MFKMKPSLVQDITLDARKLLCPLPVIRTQKAIQQLKANDILTVLATDPGVCYDIPAWCRIHGHTVLTIEKTKQEINIKIRVNSA